MAARCVNIDGVLLRVTDNFDASEGSEDMANARELVAYMREGIKNLPPRPCFARRCGRDEWHVHGTECSTSCRCGQGELQ
jgi:hypothetical protein